MNTTAYSDTDLLPLSALQHFIFCPRQCALIHLEQQWSENRFTAEGRAQHDRVDRPEHETRNGIRYEYAVLIRSLRLGLIGKADMIEFHDNGHIIPVEHKRGRPKPDHCDWVQLCAQALCLEEMLNTTIHQGAIFYGKPRRRQQVQFTPELRSETEQTAQDLHNLINSGTTPPPNYLPKKCDTCSLIEICMPKQHKTVHTYLTKTVFDQPEHTTGQS
jgi:CRISPR-associated exonuclease Cas4